jgi:hypothetical protein
MCVKCQQTLTKLRLDGSRDYQDDAQSRVQKESVYNQLVDHIKLVYTLNAQPKYLTRPYGYSSEIILALNELVIVILRVGGPFNFIKSIELLDEPHWNSNMIRTLQNIKRDARALGNRELSVLSQNLNDQYTVDMCRRNNIRYNNMVDYVWDFYTPENMSPLPMGTTLSLQTVVICLLCYGRNAGFNISKIGALDRYYWQGANPHGYATT